MPRFSYTARDRTGAAASATIDAPSRKDALRLLAARGLTPMRLDESSEAARAPARGGPAGVPAKAKSAPRVESSAPRRRSGRVTPTRQERLPFLTALEDLTSSGMSAGEAVRLLSIRIKEPRLRALNVGLWERIGEGASLSTAMAAYPDVFDTSAVNLIQAGEATGSLNDVLRRLIYHLNEQRELRRHFASSLAYPVVMMLVAIGVILFFLFFLLPRLQSMLVSLGGELPTSTRILVGVSQFLIHYGLFVVGGLAFVIASYWRWYLTEPGRLATDALLLKLPLIGPFSVSRTVLTISQTLGTLLENGITAVEALKMTARQIGNRVHRRAFEGATLRVLEGESLSAALTRTQCFPDLVLDQLAIGENTGNIVPALKKISANYQTRISQLLQAGTRVISSAVLMGVFIFVGFIAYSIVSAVFTVSSSFKF